MWNIFKTTDDINCLSVFFERMECCNTGKNGVMLMKWCNFKILDDSTHQFYYKVNTCVRPYKKSGRGVTYIFELF